MIMHVRTILRRWIEALASVYLAWCDSRRELCALVVTRDGGQYVVRQGEPAGDAMLRGFEAGNISANVPVEAGASADLLRSARNGLVILELPAAKVVMRRITVPAQARKFLAGIIDNQIERLSPWPANGVVYGFAAETGAADAAMMDVRVLISARADIDEARQELAALGLSVDRIVARGADAAEVDAGDVQAVPSPVTLWSCLADTSPDRLGGTVRAIGAGIAGLVAASFLVASWAVISTGSLRYESEDLASRVKALQRQVQSGRSGPSMAAIPPAEQMWLQKSSSISSAILIEALSRALSDSAYVNEIHLEKDSLRIMGLAEDAPAVIAPLERSGHMSDVHFVAPTARGPDGKLFRFSIEARVEPHISMGEH
jgi:general secretion pathway protein L